MYIFRPLSRAPASFIGTLTWGLRSRLFAYACYRLLRNIIRFRLLCKATAITLSKNGGNSSDVAALLEFRDAVAKGIVDYLTGGRYTSWWIKREWGRVNI
jgi:hypothetical protein